MQDLNGLFYVANFATVTSEDRCEDHSFDFLVCIGRVVQYPGRLPYLHCFSTGNCVVFSSVIPVAHRCSIHAERC